MRKTQGKRPKWAAKLPARLWHRLHDECQSDLKRPTLARLKSDLRLQQAQGVTCPTCRRAGLLAGLLAGE